VRNSGSASYTFSSLPAGDPASQYATVLYACVRDSYGASNCTTTSVTVRAGADHLSCAVSTQTINIHAYKATPTAVLDASHHFACLHLITSLRQLA